MAFYLSFLIYFSRAKKWKNKQCLVLIQKYVPIYYHLYKITSKIFGMFIKLSHLCCVSRFGNIHDGILLSLMQAYFPPAEKF